MALPKEPRQKMINLMYLVLTALLALNVSSEILNAFKVVDRSLINSNTTLAAANTTIYESLKEKLADEKTREKAAIWKPLGDRSKALSDEMNNYIEGLKMSLKKEAGLKMVVVDGKEQESFKEDNLEAATRLFAENKKGEELEKKLIAYREAMLSIHPDIRKKFQTTLPIDTKPVVGQDGKTKDFTEAYFHMTPTVAGLTLLSKFQNNVKNAENQVSTYIHEQIGAVKIIYNAFVPIVSTNATYLMPGEELEIKAGVGAFNTDAKPQVIISGNSVPVDVNGVGTWKNKVNSSGEINVVVKYTAPDGTIKEAPTSVKYVVGTPSGSAVMADKMNVFYIGVDNPITIGSPTGWDRTNVSISSGSMSGTGSKRIVRVSALGTTNITVSPQGSNPSSFPFRIKKIPDPVFKIGSGKARVPAVEFKNQQFCRADLEAFDFDLKFNVVSATVYFSGANFPNVTPSSISGNSLANISSLMQKAGPGTSVTFTNIKVAGPDGTRTIDERGITLY
jgi:gliding motility-associated protein GldM